MNLMPSCFDTLGRPINLFIPSTIATNIDFIVNTLYAQLFSGCVLCKIVRITYSLVCYRLQLIAFDLKKIKRYV